MGYETTFKLKSELDSQFIGWMTEVKQSNNDEYKNVLIALCMRALDEPDMTALHKIYREIEFSLRSLVNLYSQEWKYYLKNRLEKEGEIWFCGWDKARHGNSNVWEDEDSIINFFMKELFIKAVQPCKSAFENDTNFWNKYDQIRESLEELEDCVTDMWDHKFIDFYREHPELATEDGDDTPEPDNFEERDSEDEGEEIEE